MDKEVGELKCAISDNKKISEKLNEEFLRLTDEAEKQNGFLKTKELLSKGNSVERKLYEKLEESKKLEEALKVIQRKRKKIVLFEL